MSPLVLKARYWLEANRVEKYLPQCPLRLPNNPALYQSVDLPPLGIDRRSCCRLGNSTLGLGGQGRTVSSFGMKLLEDWVFKGLIDLYLTCYNIRFCVKNHILGNWKGDSI